MGKKSKTKSRKKASASSSPAGATSPPAPTSRPDAQAPRSSPPKVPAGAKVATPKSSSSMKERDAARIDRAARQFSPENKMLEVTEVFVSLAGKPGWFPNRESILATARNDEHRAILDKMVDHDLKMAKVMTELDAVHSKRKYKKCIEMATEAIEQNEEFVRSLYGMEIAYTPIHHIQAYQVRCNAKSQGPVADDDGVIKDATEGLAMILIRKKNVEMPEPPVQNMEARMLYDRSQSLVVNSGWGIGRSKLENVDFALFDAALRDIRAALAVARASREWWKDSKSGDINKIDEMSSLFAALTVTKKVRDGAARPHYSAESLVSFCKDACLGPYSFDRHICLGCGAVPTDTVHLQTCDTCRQFWFCGKACLSKTWKTIHKPLCKPDDAFGGRGKLIYWYVSDYEKKYIDDSIDCLGHFFSGRYEKPEKDGDDPKRSDKVLPFAVCRDANGLYYDSFTDHPFIFVPSQMDRLLEIGNSVDSTYEVFDTVAYVPNLTGKMTARQKSNFRKLAIKHQKVRKQARNHPQMLDEMVRQMELFASMRG